MWISIPNTFLDWDGPISANSSVYERIQYILLASDVLLQNRSMGIFSVKIPVSGRLASRI